MRCRCCDVALTDYEATRKSVTTNEYYDMCNRCFSTIKDDLLYKDRIDLMSSSDVDDVEIYYDDNNYDEY